LPEDDPKIGLGYIEAFHRNGCELFCVGRELAVDTPLADILKTCPRPPVAILMFVSTVPLLPDGLVRSEVPTICLHTDTYAYPERRLRWSLLFDHAAVFHPGYDVRFREGGHPSAFLSPFAVRRDLFDLPDVQRVYELGWVGQSKGAIYQNRGRLLPKLAQHFRMNDWTRTYTIEETAAIYRSSKVVVNIGRDDYPQDANMRVFEALASGALLLTSTPTELSQLGFTDGCHFVGYSKEDEIIPLVRSFLDNEPARSQIADAARAKVLREHTYDRRVESLLERLREFGARKPAPARQWSEARARLIAVDFFVAHQVLDAAFRQYLKLFARDLGAAWEGAGLLARGFASRFIRSLRNSGP
jgi:hypothetical protein